MELIDLLIEFQCEMEQQKENTQSDYWLVQYQRLMDRKPQAMIDLVSACSTVRHMLPSIYLANNSLNTMEKIYPGFYFERE